MKSIAFLKNTVQEYSWGSKTIIPKLLGKKYPTKKPQAELWMGSHPKLPSEILSNGNHTPLDQVIHKNPKALLGKKAAHKFQGELPFLFKVLAVNRPLSLQAHPDEKQARSGYQKEIKARIPLSAENRNFKDPNAKPEILCAVTPFWALCGFRPFEEMLTLIDMVHSPTLKEISKPLKKDPHAAGLKRFFTQLMNLVESKKAGVIAEVAKFARTHQTLNPAFHWITKLHKLHPNDIGMIAPLLLNLIHLREDEAIYFPPRQLHSYLEGFGMELMGNSDNVLRGGLTPKHLDVEGLIHILNFSPARVHILKPIPVSKAEKMIPSALQEFSLSMIEVRKNVSMTSRASRNIEMMICLKGNGTIEAGQKILKFRQGTSWLVPAAAGVYTIRGNAKIYKATIP